MLEQKAVGDAEQKQNFKFLKEIDHRVISVWIIKNCKINLSLEICEKSSVRMVVGKLNLRTVLLGRKTHGDVVRVLKNGKQEIK